MKFIILMTQKVLKTKLMLLVFLMKMMKHGQKSRTFTIALARKIPVKMATKALCLMYEEFTYSRIYCN